MKLHHDPRSIDNGPWQQRLTIAIDLGIASTVLLAPLFMGGRGPVGHFVLVLCVAVTATLWCVSQCLGGGAKWRWSGGEVLLLAGLGLLILQLTPLPAAVLAQLSSQISELLPLWTQNADASFQLGTWSQLTLHPLATQSGLATYIAYATLFLIVFQRLESQEDVERLLRLVAVATCLMAILGLAQFLLGNGKFLWVFEHPSRTTSDAVKGPFQNQNHFAHVLALGIGPLLWWLATSATGQPRRGFAKALPATTAVPRPIIWIAIGIVVFATLLTYSRGGVISILLAATIAVGILMWKQLLEKRTLLVMACIAGLLVVALAMYGYSPLAKKLGMIKATTSVEEFAGGRWEFWQTHFAAIPDFWLFGTGVGTHRDVYPIYLEGYADAEFTHAENGYLQILLETGFAGGLLMLVGIVCVFRWAMVPLLTNHDTRVVACTAAVLAALVASMVHSCGDFVWYIPACMTFTVLLLAAACRLYHGDLNSTVENKAPRPATRNGVGLGWLVACATCCAVGLGLAGALFPAAAAAGSWNQYLCLAKQLNVDRVGPTSTEDLARLASEVEATLAANPNNARARIHLASLYLQRFNSEQLTSQNPMPLSQIRDAAIASQFSTKADLNAWLDRAVGRNRRWFDLAIVHARRGVQLCPLQGEGYAVLSGLAFLEGPDARRKEDYIKQALLVRPSDSRVLFVAGREAMIAGDSQQAVRLWKQAFHGEVAIRNELIRELIAIVPAKDLMSVFEPDTAGMQAIFDQYRSVNDIENAKVVAAEYVRRLTDELTAAEPDVSDLQRLVLLYEFMGARAEAIRAARSVVQASPSNYQGRLNLGRLLVEAERYTEAIEHLDWCSHRNRGDEHIKKLLATAHRGAVIHQARTPGRIDGQQPLGQR